MVSHDNQEPLTNSFEEKLAATELSDEELTLHALNMLNQRHEIPHNGAFTFDESTQSLTEEGILDIPWREHRLIDKRRREKIKNEVREDKARSQLTVARNRAALHKHRAENLDRYRYLADHILHGAAFATLFTYTAIEALTSTEIGSTVGLGMATTGVGAAFVWRSKSHH